MYKALPQIITEVSTHEANGALEIGIGLEGEFRYTSCVDEGTFSDRALRDSLEAFLPLWESRPFRPNPGGMEINHSWATWYVLRKLRPSVVVESGVWAGHSTWLIENTLPEATLLSFDVDLSRRQYISDHASYFEYDLTLYDWSGVPRGDCLFFLDDHQNALERMKDLYWLGFSRIIFEDNYPLGTGDFYDLSCLQSGCAWPPIQTLPSPLTPKGIRNRLSRFLSNRYWPESGFFCCPNDNANWINASARIKTMFEFPAIQLPDRLDEPSQVTRSGCEVKQLLPHVDLGSDNDLRFNHITFVELQ